MSNVKNILRGAVMSTVRIGGAKLHGIDSQQHNAKCLIEVEQ